MDAPTISGTDPCSNCGHPRDWHRLDDSTDVSPTDPDAKFRCIGYDCETDGPLAECQAGCKDFVEFEEPGVDYSIAEVKKLGFGNIEAGVLRKFADKSVVANVNHDVLTSSQIRKVKRRLLELGFVQDTEDPRIFRKLPNAGEDN